ncbi:symmetrical bis(5'-nucleosyl)-tetraphosphatase [Marinomonas epiphytica]
MSTYVIGDVQGCLTPLIKLLEMIQFQQDKDTLWFAGDLINRGPESLETLRFIKSLGDSAISILGNHDLHLLAVAYGHGSLKRSDTLMEILSASDRDDLIEWLRHLPLCHYDAQQDTIMTHAGVPPCWTLEQTIALAREVERALQGDQYMSFFANMYGNKPATWRDDLEGIERLRCITNYLTRMRFCDVNSKLDLKSKESPDTTIDGYAPWFNHPSKLPSSTHVTFGHWAALEGISYITNIHALDTGCVWGGSLTALRLEDKERFCTPCSTDWKIS